MPQQLDVDTTPVPNMLPTGPVVYVASYAGGVFALDAETGVQVWPNAAVTGVSELTLWREPAHVRRDGGPPEPARAILIRLERHPPACGAWIRKPVASCGAAQCPLAACPRPWPISGALLVTASRMGILPGLATRRRADRRHPRLGRRQHDALGLRRARLRNDQRRHIPEPDRRVADLSRPAALAANLRRSLARS